VVRTDHAYTQPHRYSRSSRAAVSSNVFLRLPQVLARVPISRSTLWRRVNDGTFPRPLKLSDRVTVWRSEDIDDWMRQQQ